VNRYSTIDRQDWSFVVKYWGLPNDSWQWLCGEVHQYMLRPQESLWVEIGQASASGQPAR